MIDFLPVLISDDLDCSVVVCGERFQVLLFLNKTFVDRYIEKLIKIRLYSLFTSMMEQNNLADGSFNTDSFMAFKTTVL